MFDAACFDLAEHFLGKLAPEKTLNELAQHIQTEIEDWINYRSKEAAAAMSNATTTGDSSEGQSQ